MPTSRERMDTIVRLRELTEKLEREESRAALTSYIEHSIPGVIVSDANGVILMVNGAAEKIFGTEKLVGSQVESLMPERYRERHREGLKRLKEGKPSRIQGKVVRAEGLRSDGTTFAMALLLTTSKEKDVVTAVILDLASANELAGAEQL